jgi:hypothetical protein
MGILTQTAISNLDDVIDSRDVIERIEALQETSDPEEKEELEILEELAEEASNYAADWVYGETLIRESYFTEYVMEMLSDIGDLPRDIPWYIEIDEEKTAENIKQDYTEVDYDGVTYLIR